MAATNRPEAPSSPNDPERPALVDEIVHLNHDVRRQFFCDIHRIWLDVEITMPQLKTLLVLYGMDRASMGELAVALGVGVSTLTGIVDRLVDHGLVVREEDQRDRRVVVGRLTPAGAALVDRLIVAARDRLSSVLAELSLDELRLVARAFAVLDRATQRAFGHNGAAPTGARPATSNKE